MKKAIITGLSMLLLTACATPYQALNTTAGASNLGGVQATQLTSDTAQVTSRGNPFTDPDLVQRYAFRKAAEATLASGYDLFVIDPEFQFDMDRTTKNSVGIPIGGAQGVSISIIVPGRTFIIKMYKYPATVVVQPIGVWDAHQLEANLGPKP